MAPGSGHDPLLRVSASSDPDAVPRVQIYADVGTSNRLVSRCTVTRRVDMNSVVESVHRYRHVA